MQNKIDYSKFVKASPEERLKTVNKILTEVKVGEIQKTDTLLHGAVILKLADAIDVAKEKIDWKAYQTPEREGYELLTDLALVLRKNTAMVTRAKSKLKALGFTTSAYKIIQEMGIPKIMVDEFITELEQRKPNPLGYYSGGYQGVFFTDGQVVELKNRFPSLKMKEDRIITLTINMSKNTLLEMLEKNQPIILNFGVTENEISLLSSENRIKFLRSSVSEFDFSVRALNVFKPKQIIYIWNIAECYGGLPYKVKREAAGLFTEHGLDLFSMSKELLDEAKGLTKS